MKFIPVLILLCMDILFTPVQTQTASVWLYFWTLFCSVELCVYPANTILSLIT